MGLSASRLSADIISRWKADPAAGFSSPMSPAQEALLKAMTDAIAAAVVAELQGHAQVNVTSVSGVTAGTDSSGSGTGTVS